MTTETVHPPANQLPTAARQPAPPFAERQPDDRARHELVRRVEQAAAVFGVGIEVVGPGNRRVVVQDAGRVRVVVALRELVVVEPAVGVADAATPPARGALVELRSRRRGTATAPSVLKIMLTLSNCGNGRSS